MATKTRNVMNEIWVNVPGSYEETQRAISKAVRDSKLFGSTENSWDIGLEATFKDYCIVSNMSGNDGTEYYQADYVISDDGTITFSNIEKVQAKVAMKAVTECKVMVENILKGSGMSLINELFDAEIILEQDEDGKKKKKGRVKVCQRANTENGNSRIYEEGVLKEAYDAFNEKITKFGGALMDSQHRTKEGKNHRDILQSVAVTKKISWNDTEKTIGLDEIELIDTDAGRNMQVVVESGVKVQVSQRAIGKSIVVMDEDTGKVYEKVTKLIIDGFDFVPSGEASVGEADFELTEERLMNAKKVVTEDDLKVFGDTLKNEIVGAVKDAIKPAEVQEAETVPEVVPVAPADITVDDLPDADDTVIPDAIVPDAVPKVESKPATDPAVMKSLVEIQKKMDNTNKDVATIMKDRDLVFLEAVGQKVVGDVLATEDYNRFSEKQKATISAHVDAKSLYGIVDTNDLNAITEKLKVIIDGEAKRADQYIADAKLEAMGYKKGAMSGLGVTHVKVMSESKPWMEWCVKATEMVESKLLRLNSKPVLEVTDPRIMELLERFDDTFGAKLLLESGEEVQQIDIGPRVAMIARTMVAAAYRRNTALAVCETGLMGARIEDVPVQAWLPTETDGRIDTDMALLEVGEGGTVQKAGITYSNFPLLATAKKLGAQITAEALATAKGTIMNPLADTIAGLTLDISRRMDRLLWQMQITAAQSRNVTQVTGFETLTQVGSTAEYQSLNEGWLKFQWVKAVDAGGNPTGANLQPLIGTTGSGTTYQKIVVQNSNSDAFTYGTHYTVNDADGSVTLTTAGIALLAAFSLQAKYSYTTNAYFWSMTPPTGVQLYDHLVNLRRSVGQASVAIGTRNYEPNYVGFSLDTEDLVTSGPQFTEAGKTPADILTQFNTVMTYAGKESIKTSAIPRSWVIVGVKGKTLYKIHTPINLKGPITSATTGDDDYIAIEFSGNDIPSKDPFCIVGITDIPT